MSHESTSLRGARTAALGDRDQTGTRSVFFRRGAAAYGDASQRLAGARTQERAFLRGTKSKIDVMLNGAPPHIHFGTTLVFCT